MKVKRRTSICGGDWARGDGSLRDAARFDATARERVSPLRLPLPLDVNRKNIAIVDALQSDEMRSTAALLARSVWKGEYSMADPLQSSTALTPIYRTAHCSVRLLPTCEPPTAATPFHARVLTGLKFAHRATEAR